MVIPLLLAWHFAQAQIRVSQGEVTTLSVESKPNQTYSWELYSQVEGINFAATNSNCPEDKAKFINGNTGNSVDVQWLQPGTYFYKVTVKDNCTNNIKIGEVIVKEKNAPNVILTKTADKSVVTEVDDEIIYTLTVKNLGKEAVKDVLLTDPLTGLSRKIARIEPNDSVVIQTSYYVKAEDLRQGYIENIATVKGESTSDQSFSVVGEKIITVVFANLSIAKTVDNAKPIIGENVRFTLTVVNNGEVAANGAKVLDKIPSGYTYISDDSNGDYNTETSIWNIGTIEAGGVRTLSYLLRVNKDGDYVNVAQVTYNSLDADTIDNIDTRSTTPQNPVVNIEIPEIFTPNGDGIQDYFRIKGLQYYPNAKIKIYNRWGNLVYEQEHYGNIDKHGLDDAWWNGISNQRYLLNQEVLPSSTYFYILELNDAAEPISGYVYLNNVEIK